MKLHQRLKELRTSKDMMLKDLAERTSLSISYLSDIERGRTTPSIGTLETLANALGISVLDLLTGVDFAGDKTNSGLPLGLPELLEDKELGGEITPEWVSLLSRIELRGKRPQSKIEWLELYLHLKRLLEN